jgi:hypothetical protein
MPTSNDVAALLPLLPWYRTLHSHGGSLCCVDVLVLYAVLCAVLLFAGGVLWLCAVLANTLLMYCLPFA